MSLSLLFVIPRHAYSLDSLTCYPLTCAEIRTSTVEISDEMRGRSIQKAKVRTTWIPSQFLMRWTNMLFLLICSLSYGILHCVEKYWPWTLSADWDIAGKDRQLWWADGGQHWRGICRRWRRAVLEISTLQFFLTLFFPFCLLCWLCLNWAMLMLEMKCVCVSMWRFRNTYIWLIPFVSWVVSNVHCLALI